MLAEAPLAWLLFAVPVAGVDAAPGEEEHGTGWPLSWAIGVMTVVTLLVVWMSEILVGTVEQASTALGLSSLFVVIIVVAVVGNAAWRSQSASPSAATRRSRCS